ncbi:tetratricopeptide repeat protein [Natrialbaceae archaeon A-CW1-1]
MVDPVVGAALVAPIVVKTGEKAFEKGIVDIIDSAKKVYKSETQRKKWDEELERTATVFHEKLQGALKQIARENNDEHLEEIANNWGEVALELDHINLSYERQEDVIDQICDAIETNLEQQLPEQYARTGVLRRAIETAYAHSLYKFADDIEGTELAERLQHEVNRDVITELRQISDQLELIDRYLDRYEHFNEVDTCQHSEWQERASGILAVDEYYQPYTPPSKLWAVADHQYLLIVGRAGTGKTRALLETLDEINTENLNRVIIPKRSFRTLADVEPLCNRNYDGDVLFLWDDIHKFADSNEGIESVIQKLRTKVEDDGHKLWVRLTIRREEFDRVFEEQDRPERLSGEFWKEFEAAEIDTSEYFTEERVDHLVDSAIKRYNIDANPRVRQNLVQQVVKAAPNPEYVDAICKTVRDEADGRLTAAYIDNLPEDALTTWVRRCEQLESTKPDYFRILKAIWVVDRLDIMLTASPVKYLYTEWCNGNREFELGLKYLNSRGWIFVEETSNGTWLQIHDIRLEAIEQSVPDFKGNERELKELSEALQDSALEWELGGDPEPDLPAIIHSNFAQFLAKSFVYHDRFGTRFQSMANTHFEKGIELSRETISVYANYAKYLDIQGELDRAHEIYEEALEKEPANTSIRTDFAQLLRLRNMTSQSITILEEGVRLSPENSQFKTMVVWHLRRQGEIKRAISVCEKNLEYNPDDTDIREKLAFLLENQGEVERAIDLYEEGLDRNPADTSLRAGFAYLLENQGEVERASEQYKKGLDYSPDDPTLRAGFAYLLENQGEVERASEHYKKGLDYTPNDTPLRARFASLLAEQGEVERAIDLYEEGLDHTPGNAVLQSKFTSLLVERGEVERAISVYEKSLDHNPDDPFTRKEFASWLVEQGEVERAIDLYEEGLDHTPGGIIIRRELASLLENQGEIERAIHLYEEGLNHTPGDTTIRRELASLLENQGEIERAIHLYEQGLDHNPGSAFLRAGFASLLTEQGEVKRATHIYEEGLDHTPNHPSLRVKFASWLVEQGEVERASDVYEEGLDHIPGNTTFRAKFASWLVERGEVEQAINEYEIALGYGLNRFSPEDCPVESCEKKIDYKSLPDHLRAEHLT